MKYKEKWIFSFEKKIDSDTCTLEMKDVYITDFNCGKLYMCRVSDNKLKFATEGFTRHQVEVICNDLKGRRIRNLDFSTFELCKAMFIK